MSIYESIYKKIEKLIPDISDLQVGDARKSKSSGYMDLNLDVLDRLDTDLGKEKGWHTTITIALSHYYKHDCGDMIPDPDMEIKVCPQMKTAEALTYQDSYGYQRVYPEPGKYYPKLKTSLNSFLNTWMKNCLDQKHDLSSDVIITSNILDNSDIYINKIKLTPYKSQKVHNHSPNGFNYGYEGSGPSQLALAILLEAVPKDIAIQNYHQFKSDVIATKDQNEQLKITKSEIKDWLEKNIPSIDAAQAVDKLIKYKTNTRER